MLKTIWVVLIFFATEVGAAIITIKTNGTETVSIVTGAPQVASAITPPPPVVTTTAAKRRPPTPQTLEEFRIAMRDPSLSYSDLKWLSDMKQDLIISNPQYKEEKKKMRKTKLEGSPLTLTSLSVGMMVLKGGGTSSSAATSTLCLGVVEGGLTFFNRLHFFGGVGEIHKPKTKGTPPLYYRGVDVKFLRAFSLKDNAEWGFSVGGLKLSTEKKVFGSLGFSYKTYFKKTQVGVGVKARISAPKKEIEMPLPVTGQMAFSISF